MPDAAIALRNLTKKYGRTVAVADLSLEVSRGEIYGFVGPNGAGKTTTLGMLLGAIRPSSGSCEILGRSATHELIRQHVGATLGAPVFYDQLSGKDNLRMAAAAKGARITDVESALETVGLAFRADSRVGEYSVGMRQRLALGAALLGDPDILVLDEPTDGLDPEAIHSTRTTLHRLAGNGTTVFFSSHQLGEVERLCSSIAFIREGRLELAGSRDEILRAVPVMRVRLAEPMPSLTDRLANFSSFVWAEAGNGSELRVVLETTDTSSLEKFLRDHNVAFLDTELVSPSLEEVFMGLMNRRGRQKAVSA